MISIIIASADAQLLENVRANIAETVGIDYEVLSFDNSEAEMGLCQIYNLGAQQAKFEYLCYMHEDIEILTKNWGEKIVKTFEENKDFGIIGLAGCKYKSSALSGWGAEYEVDEIAFINYIQSYKYSTKPKEKVYYNSTNSTLAEVATVDGMWFCTKKDIAIQHRFDEEIFKGFHVYDLDFCINVGRSHKIGVTFDILIAHYSEGNFSKRWLQDSLKLHSKWINTLPINKIDGHKGINLSIEKKAFEKQIQLLIKSGYNFDFIKSILSQYYYAKKIGLKRYIKLYLYLCKCMYFNKAF